MNECPSRLIVLLGFVRRKGRFMIEIFKNWSIPHTKNGMPGHSPWIVGDTHSHYSPGGSKKVARLSRIC